jgi:hypothetical protein
VLFGEKDEVKMEDGEVDSVSKARSSEYTRRHAITTRK